MGSPDAVPLDEEMEDRGPRARSILHSDSRAGYPLIVILFAAAIFPGCARRAERVPQPLAGENILDSHDQALSSARSSLPLLA